MKNILNQKGFTLIEVLAAMVLMGIVLSATMINIQTNQDAVLKKHANELVQDIRNIRMKTIYEKNTNYKIYFGSDYYTVLLSSDTLKKVTLNKDIMMNGSYELGNLSFTLAGVASRPGNIVLTNKRGKKIEITVEFTTGRVRMYELGIE